MKAYEMLCRIREEYRKSPWFYNTVVICWLLIVVDIVLLCAGWFSR